MSNLIAELADTNTTIVAISTPHGVGGIAVARLSGPDAIIIADRIWRGKPLSEAKSHTAHFGTVLDSNDSPLDQAVATIFIAPASFTGQNTVEFAVHGSKYIQRELIASLVRAGAVLARPGEFTRRAFTSGRLGLSQAEAIADIIATDSRAAHRLAMSQMKGSFDNKIKQLRQQLIDLVSLLELELDFAEEDVIFADRQRLRQNAADILQHINKLLKSFHNGNAIRNGIPVAIVGPTNAGKSSLLNALVDDNRAIVSDIHGTTRDTIEETAEIGDYLFRFIDTAGLRETNDPIERLGIERSRQSAQNALVIINLVDATDPAEGLRYAEEIAAQLQPHQTQIVAVNKSDIATLKHDGAVAISATTGFGLDTLRTAMTTIMDKATHPADDTKNDMVTDTAEDIIITNQRHAETLARASQSTQAIIDGLDNDIPTDLIAQDARATIDTLSELTGQITTTDILTTIFSRFCIGK